MSKGHYEGSAQEFDVVLEERVEIAARDGVALATDLYRPARAGQALDGQFPTV